jgi:enterochelin esterase-like enzyme
VSTGTRVIAAVAAMALLGGGVAYAQQAPAPAAAQRGAPAARGPSAPQVVSPDVLPDHRVVIRIHAPKATDVSLTGDWVAQGRGSAGPLQKDSQGIWSITVGPLVPDFYTYTLTVDGVRTLDPRNPQVKVGVSSLENILIVAGEETAFADNLRVPHGEVRQVWYWSANLKQMRRMHVYTPPGYETSGARYPVLYLIHGGGDEDSGWTTIGRANFIVDNLLAAGKVKPMIVVMPNGSISLPGATMGQARGVAAGGRPDMSASLSVLHDAFGEDLLENIIPYVEKQYRVLTNQPDRALAGLSMGGAETMRNGPPNMDKFAYLGVFSMGWNDEVNPDFETRNARFFEDPARTNKLIRLFWIGVGKSDALIGTGAKRLSDLLTRRGIKNEYHESDGGHTWINWRVYLRDFLPRLFQ